MKAFILGKKSIQSQQFTEAGVRIPVTVVEADSCYLMSVTDQAKQGYCAVKLAFGKTANIKKPANGELKKAGIKTPLRFFREMRVDEDAIVDDQDKKGWTVGEATLFVGDQVKPNVVFKKGDKVDVTATSKGKGFQGGVRRHGFAGGPKTHGQSDRWRAPGSIGQTTTPGRVYKGKRMAGRMGGDRVTVKGLEVVEVTETGLIIKGLVPGAQTGLLQIRSSKN